MTAIEGPAPGTPEWDAARLKGIGASEAGAVLGLSDYATPLDVYCTKREIGEGFQGNKFTERGKRFEPMIVEDFTTLTGIPIKRYPVPMFVSADNPFMFATPDALLESELEGLEVKNTGFSQAKKFGDEHTDEIPIHFIAQAQHQAAVMGWETVHFCVWIDCEPHLYLVRRNERFIELMIKAESELWQRILAGDPPTPDFSKEHTPGLIRNLYGLTTGKSVELPSDVGDLWQRREQARLIEASAKKRKEELQAEIEYAMGDAAIGILPGLDFQLSRSFINPCQIKEHTRAGYYVLKSKKVKDGIGRISSPTEAVNGNLETDNLQRLVAE